MRIFTISAAAISLVTAAALAQTELGQVNDVLDQLERRLLDKESDALSYGESPETSPKNKANSSFQYGTLRIEGDGENSDLKVLTGKIAELENDIETLASQVQNTKQAVLDDAAIDNFVSIASRIENMDRMAIKSVEVKIDGYKVYEFDDTAGLWTPSGKLPIYTGPLKPGRHRIDLSTRVVIKRKKPLPLSDQVYHFVGKSFDLTIPSGHHRGSYEIVLTTPEDLGGRPDASLKKI